MWPMFRRLLIKTGGIAPKNDASLKIYKYDYLVRLLIRFKCTPIIFYFIMLSINLLYYCLSKDSLPGSFFYIPDKFFFIFVYIICFPVGFGYVIWWAKAPYNLFRDLKSSGVLRETIDDKWFAEFARSRYKLFFITIPGAILSFALLYIVNYSFVDKSYSFLPFIPKGFYLYTGLQKNFICYQNVFFILIIYCIFSGIINGINVIAMLKKLFKTKVELNILDKCGGLLPIKKYVSNCNCIIIATGIFFGVMYYENYLQCKAYLNNLILVPGTLFYIFISFYLYIAPLNVVGETMKATKEKWLKEITMKFSPYYRETYENTLSGVDKDFKTEQETIALFFSFYERIESFVVWPSGIVNLQKTFTIIIPFFTGIGIELLRRFLFPDK